MSLAAKLLKFLGIQEVKNFPYWLKITTKVPKCVYYFGPFDSPLEAKALQGGYIEDLISENAQGIHIEIEHGSQPESLTVCEEEIF